MDVQPLARVRIDLANTALGTVFVFFGCAACAVAAIRKRTEVLVLVWLGLWSGMYGLSLLLRTPLVKGVLPGWVGAWSPFTVNAISYLLVVVGMLVWSELTLGKLRQLTLIMVALGLAIALLGIGEFLMTGSGQGFLPYNNLLAVCALISLTAAVVLPGFPAKFLVVPNRILAVGTLIFTAEALFRNIWGWLGLPRVPIPFLDETAFALFLFSFAYVAVQKLFASERRLLAIESELEIARQIQASILPTGTPQVENLQIAASYRPMTAVGGDFYHFIQVDQRHIGFLVADVSGHGIPAALISTMLKVAMQSVVSCAENPARLLHELNRILSDQLQGQLISAAYLWLDLEARKGTYSAAGHPPLLRWREGRLDRIESNGLLFGVLPDLVYPVCEMALYPGDRFLLYTDGVVEPENAAGAAFGDCQLEQVVRINQCRLPAELSDRLLTEVRHWQPASVAQQDDITLIVIDVK